MGVDVPRPKPATVLLQDKLHLLDEGSPDKLAFLAGESPDGREVAISIVDLPHLLVAGSTGSGKTIFLYAVITSLLHQHGADTLQLLLVDPKQTDFIYFEQLPHLRGGRVIIDPEEAIEALDRLLEEDLHERTQRLRQARCRNIQDYNSSVSAAEKLSYIVVVIDEYADLVQVLGNKERDAFEGRLTRLAQRARNVGIHLVIATQRPSADIVTSRLKTNLSGRIAFSLPSYHDSMTILDESGAENLVGRGDMLAKIEGTLDRLQGYYISPEELDAFIQSKS